MPLAAETNIVPLSMGRFFPLPLTTIGSVSSTPLYVGPLSDTCQVCLRFATLLVLICLSIENPVSPLSPNGYAQLFVLVPAGAVPLGSHGYAASGDVACAVPCAAPDADASAVTETATAANTNTSGTSCRTVRLRILVPPLGGPSMSNRTIDGHPA